jgi:hypothetical protein
MRLIRSGATRYVLLTRRYAFKIPSLRNWRCFLWGLLANMQERAFGTLGLKELCPVLFYLPGGFLVVMPKAEVMDEDAFADFDYEGFINSVADMVLPVEEKASSFGMLDGRVVAIDYGS